LAAIVVVMVVMMRIVAIGSNGIGDLSNDTRPSNGSEQADRDASNVGSHFHLPFRLLLLSLLRQTLGRTSKHLAAFGTVGISIGAKRAAKHALHDKPNRTRSAFLSASFMQKPAIGAGDTFTHGIGGIR
jgi:hypothetical protein